MGEVIIPQFSLNRRQTRTYDTRTDNAKDVLKAIIANIPPSGSLQATLSAVEPDGGAWKLCDGQSLSKAEFPTLYAAIAGTVPETDTEFSLPDLSGRLLMGRAGSLALGGFTGTEAVTLLAAQMPEHGHAVVDAGHGHTFSGAPHTHTVNDPGHSHTSATTGGVATGAGTDGAISGTTGTSATGVTISEATAGGAISNEQSGVSVENTGGGEAFNIIPPVIAVNWLIRT
jgi:microcystin-dependent protein